MKLSIYEILNKLEEKTGVSPEIYYSDLIEKYYINREYKNKEVVQDTIDSLLKILYDTNEGEKMKITLKRNDIYETIYISKGLNIEMCALSSMLRQGWTVIYMGDK